MLTIEKNVQGGLMKTHFASNSSSAGLWEEILLHTCGASLQNVHFKISHRALDDLLILCSNLCNKMSYKTFLSRLPGGYLYMRNTSLIVAGKTEMILLKTACISCQDSVLRSITIANPGPCRIF